MSVLDEKISEAKKQANPHFMHCCGKACIEPTLRELKKFQDKRGAAYGEHLKIAAGNRGGKERCDANQK